MKLMDILIILGCLAGGYWIVSSIMGPGVDITRRTPESPQQPGAAPAAPPRLPNPHRDDWHLLLDVPRSADRTEIEAAFKRQQQKALASFDTPRLEQLKQAREAALAQLAR